MQGASHYKCGCIQQTQQYIFILYEILESDISICDRTEENMNTTTE
jgi:hypothetical protein